MGNSQTRTKRKLSKLFKICYKKKEELKKVDIEKFSLILENNEDVRKKINRSIDYFNISIKTSLEDYNLLHLACYRGHIEIVKILLKIDKVKLDYLRYPINTFLIAFKNKNYEIVKILMNDKRAVDRECSKQKCCIST